MLQHARTLSLLSPWLCDHYANMLLGLQVACLMHPAAEKASSPDHGSWHRGCWGWGGRRGAFLGPEGEAGGPWPATPQPAHGCACLAASDGNGYCQSFAQHWENSTIAGTCSIGSLKDEIGVDYLGRL